MNMSRKATESKNNAPALRVLEENEIVSVSGGDAAPAPTTPAPTTASEKIARFNVEL